MALRRKKEEVWDGTERRRPASVLVVNDDPAARELLIRFLGHAGYLPDGAGSDTEAMYRMVQHLPRCVILDMQSGGVGSSLKILDQIRSHDDHRISSARVVLCASSARNAPFSFESGVDAFVVRPFHIDDLLAHVADVLQRPQHERAKHRRDQLSRLS